MAVDQAAGPNQCLRAGLQAAVNHTVQEVVREDGRVSFLPLL